jgi:membrane protease YdiL (CAAX protease family)
MIGDSAGWRIGDAAMAVLAGLVTGTLAQALLGFDELTVMGVFGVVVPAQTLGTLAALAAIVKARSIDAVGSLGLSVEPGDLTGLLVGGGLQIVLTLVTGIVLLILEQAGAGELPEQEVVELAGDALSSPERVAVIMGSVVLAPLSEELIFRGVLLRAVLARWGERAAVYGTAVTFGAFHLIDPNAVVAVPALVVVGIVLARQVMATGRLARALFTHVGFNLVSIIVLFLVEGL